MNTRAMVVSSRRVSSALLLAVLIVLLLLPPMLAPRPARAAAILKVQYRVGDASATDNQIVPSFVIVNAGDMAAALSELKLRYYFTWEGTTQTQQFWCDWAQVGCGALSGSFVKLPSAVPGADHYLELGFTGTASVAAGGQSGDIQIRFNKSDWSAYSEADDYSYDATKTAYTDQPKVALYRAGTLVWGTPPGGVTPPTNTATRTNTPVGPTNTRTNTPVGPTNTRTNTPLTPSPAACGTTNVAVGKAATASSNETADFPPTLAVDGSGTTRWSSAWSDPQWIQVDLGSTQSICRVRLNWEPAYGRAYQLQASNDLVTWATLFSTTTGDGGIDDLAGLSGSGRYVRMTGTARATTYGYSLWELEIYTGSGGPGSTATPTRTGTNTPIGLTATRTNTRTNTPGSPTATRTRTNTAVSPTPSGCGTTNVAVGKAATASSNETATLTPNLAVDGNGTTRWASVQAVDPQWLQVDLGSTQSICRIVLSWEAAYGSGYQLQVSNDGVNFTPIKTVTGENGGIDDHTGLAGSGRYVRMHGTARGTAWGYSLWEFEIYTGSGGTTPSPTRTSTPAPSGNLALNRPATADSSCAATEGPDKAVNGSVIGGNPDKWCSLGATKWMQVDLGASFSLTRFVVKHAGAGGESSTLNTRDFTIQVSVDNVSWTTVVNVTGNTLNETSNLIAATTARYVRLNVTAPTNTTDGAARIYELEVYGESVGPTVTPNPNNRAPTAPVITEPGFEGKVANPGDVHMETGFLSDPDTQDTHRCTDWEIWNSTQTERVWFTSCIGGVERMHTHLGDGLYQGSHAGRSSLLPETNYVLRVRHRDSSNAANDWSPYATRAFRTSAVTIGDPNQKWALRQTGYELEIVASNLQLPVNIAFKPNAGTAPGDAYFYVTELYGIIKVVKRDGSVSDYATGLLNYNPSGLFPGSGEQGLTGLVVDPATGDVYAGMLYRAANGSNYPKVVRFTSTNGGLTAATQTTILDMAGESQGQSHQISNMAMGPDGKLYVHNGDGFDSTVGVKQNSFRGKILRLNLDGSPAIDNPFYSAADGINAKDYIYAYGFRNPFGGAWRESDGQHYEVSNGPSVDRFAKVPRGTNFGYDGSDASMRNLAIQSFPATGAVNMAFIQPGTFGGSGFPADKQGHVYISHSGCTFCNGPSVKHINEYVLNADGSYNSGPFRLLDYTGTGKATVSGLAAGPDGLYFTDLYTDNSTSAPTRGANVYRLRWRGL